MPKQLSPYVSCVKVLANLIGVLGASTLTAYFTAFPAYSQSQTQTLSTPNYRVVNPPVGIGTPQIKTNVTPNIGGIVSYPYGSRVYNSGAVETPNGQVIAPAVTVDRGNGSKSYYYPDGSRIDTNGSAIPPVGTFIK